MYEATSDLNGADRKPGLSRRQLVKAGAWAAPAIAITIATPAASASGNIVAVSGYNQTQVTAEKKITGISVSITNSGPLTPSGTITITLLAEDGTVVTKGAWNGGSGSINTGAISQGTTVFVGFGDFNTKPLTAGTYKFRVTFTPSGGQAVSRDSGTFTVA
ncbi:hypothetical protein [Microbacterium sp. P5_E9]